MTLSPGAATEVSLYPCSASPGAPQVVATVTTPDRVLMPVGDGTVCVSSSSATAVVVDLEAWLVAAV